MIDPGTRQVVSKRPWKRDLAMRGSELLHDVSHGQNSLLGDSMGIVLGSLLGATRLCMRSFDRGSCADL